MAYRRFETDTTEFL